MRSVLIVAVLLVVAAAGAPPPAAAQRQTPASAATSAATSAAARAAQRDFERRRRDRLPAYQGGGAGGPCEVRIGRLCYWNNNHDAPPPPEPAAVAAARDRLLDRLATAAADHPADAWIVGQRVRYLAEAGRHDDAVSVAADCRAADAGWCDALRGLAHHERGDHADAAIAFDRALAALSEPERCRWTDFAWWLDGALARDYRRQPCGPARDAWSRRFFLAARPLLALPGDDLRNELLARRTMSRIRSQGAIEYAMAWGDDFAELETRYGWPTAWTVRETGFSVATASRSVVGHEPTPSFAFVPRLGAVAAPVASRADDWDLAARHATARYAPRYARRGFHALPHQIARFRRGDSTLVVAAWNVEDDRAWRSDSLPHPRARADSPPLAALVVVDSAGAFRVARDTVARDAGVAPRGALALPIPARPHLVSLELLDPRRGRAARARYGVAPLPADALVSDLLLLARAPAAAPDASVESLLADALGTRTIAAGTSVGLYWETYFPRDTAGVQIAVQATRIDAAWYDRVGRVLHVGGGPRTPVAVRFVDSARPSDGTVARALALTWPAKATGTFRLEVTVRSDDHAVTAAEIVRVVP